MNLFLTKAVDKLFLITKEHVFITGAEEIYDLEGNTKSVNLKDLIQYQCTKEEALNYLKNNWNQSIEQSKKSWSELNQFSKLIGQNIDVELPEDLSKHLGNLEGTLKNKKTDVSELIQQLFPQEEQNEITTAASRMLKEILGDVAGTIPKDTDKLEDWANKLHNRFFAKEEKQKEAARKAEIRKTVRESIAQRLRENGIEPVE